MQRRGGRTEANRRAVARAVLKLLSRGHLLFDAQDVADISGVHRTTIRRRWPNRDALIAEAMAEHTSGFSLDPGGDWRSVLQRIAFGLRDFMSDPTESGLNRLLAVTESAEFIDAVTRQWGILFEDLAAPLVKAQKRGDIRADADIHLILLSLASTFLTLTVYNRRSPSDRVAKRLVQQAIGGMLPAGSRQSPARRR
jgi:AcrR family transcriptional regulator